MTTDYRLDFYDDAGDLDSKITDFSDLSYTKIVNRAGILQFQLRGDHFILSRIADKWQVYVYRRPSGIDWQLDFIGIFRDENWIYGEKPVFVGTCPGLLSMLSWRHVLYYAAITDLTKFIGIPAETIMKTLVDYNCGANATVVNGRLREGTIPDLTTEADLARGNPLDFYCTWINILDALGDLAETGGGDFDLVKTIDGDYDFRFYLGQLGTDRRGDVYFGLERGNMGNPKYNHLRSDEKTVALVGGQGELEFRQTAVVTGVNYAADNNIEVFIDARDIELDQATALEDRGEQKLFEIQAREAFTFDVLQTPGSKYGVDYFLGDLVNAINPFNDQVYDQKIEAVTIGFDRDGKEAIQIRMRKP